jgi:hypothetical protein
VDLLRKFIQLKLNITDLFINTSLILIIIFKKLMSEEKSSHELIKENALIK